MRKIKKVLKPQVAQNVVSAHICLDSLEKQKELWRKEDCYLNKWYWLSICRTIKALKVYLLRFELESDITDIKQYVLDSVEKEFIKIYDENSVEQGIDKEILRQIWIFEISLNMLMEADKTEFLDNVVDNAWLYRDFYMREVEPIIETRPVVRERCKSCGRFLATKKYISTCKGVKFKKAYVEIKCKCGHLQKVRKSDII